MNRADSGKTGRQRTQHTLDRERFYWLGGSPCSGKSTIAEMLGAQYGLQIYHCDDFFFADMRAADPHRQPRLHKIARMSWDEILSRPVPEQLADVLQIYREGFPLMMRDLVRRQEEAPPDIQFLVEGAALLPELITPLLPEPRRAIFLVPMPAFQRRVYARREWRHALLAECRDPEQAWENWMERDVQFGRWMRARAHARGLAVLTVDGAKSVEENAVRVQRHFQLPAAEG